MDQTPGRTGLARTVVVLQVSVQLSREQRSTASLRSFKKSETFMDLYNDVWDVDHRCAELAKFTMAIAAQQVNVVPKICYCCRLL